MKDYSKAETKVVASDANRVRTEAKGYTPARGKAYGASETGSSAKLGGCGSSGNKSRHHRHGSVFGTALVVLLTFIMVFASLLGAFADDLVNTVPNEEASGDFYSGTINTGFAPNGYTPPSTTYGPGYGPYNVDGVYQSQSTASATSFAAGLPLGTIFIDQSKISDTGGVTEVVSKDTAIIAGLTLNSGQPNQMGYDGTKPGAIKMVPGKINELNGDLFKVTFPDAAILPNGERADLVITYSNAKIVIDQRYLAAPPDEQYYHGAVYLARGNAFNRGGTDATDFSTVSYKTAAENLVLNYIQNNYGTAKTFKNTSSKVPSVGTSLDATYQIVNKDGTPAAGTFVYAISGINLDRDPDMGGAIGSGNNVNKPLWYSYEDSFSGENGKDYSFFSEAMEILGGQESEYVYVRPNTNQEDNPDAGITPPKGQYFWPNVSKTDEGNIKFISNGLNSPSLGGHDASYSAGFVTLADAAKGFKVTATGHGSQAQSMNSLVFNSKQIWYRYVSGSGKHGRIETTSEGNWGGKLNDGGTVLDGGENPHAEGATGDEKPNTYVIAEGKTVTYTMTPDIGYKLKKLTVNGEEVEYDGDAVSKMKKGDTVTVTTAAGHAGVLKYEEDGTYTFKFVYAEHDEEIFVEWEPTTADVLVAKRWQDEDDKDGLRAAATMPNVKLQYSTNRGRTWTDVTDKVGNYNIADFADPVTQQTVPDGNFLDGSYDINNDQTGRHPYTWEYLPVYTYDSNGIADSAILYRIVELPDPGIADYLKAQYFDDQSFDLTSPKTKTKDGWLVFDNTTGTEYVQKGDGLYYEVTDGLPAADPADPQPKASDLTPHSSDEYWTVDKGTPYQAVEVKNEHTPREVYIDLTKFWNDATIYGVEATDGNDYARRKLTFVLHGETADRPVDLNGDDEGDDREIIIEVNESDDKADVTGDKTIDGYTIYKDSSGTEYALVNDDSTHEDGYYPVSGETIDYESGPATPSGHMTPVPKGDGTYKIDDNNFGALIEHLSTHEGGKPITYTITEKIGGIAANDNELPWTTTGGTLNPVKNSKEEIIGYTTQFTNTPVIDKDVKSLPLTIEKHDKLTGAVLEDATFTVYTNTATKEKAAEYQLEKIDGKQVYTNQITKYIKKDDNKYYEVNESGVVATAPADPQPDVRSLKDSYTGSVEDNEVTTDAAGQATITFKAPGTYYVMETEAPAGYNVDPTTYTFVVDEKLNSIRLQSADVNHETKWWKKLYDLLFGDGTTEEENWEPTPDKDGGTLTVDDDPIRANILINKVWDDKNDQDGLRNYAVEFPKVKIQKTTDPADEDSWVDVNSDVIPAPDKTIPDHNAPLIVDQDNYYTWDNLPAYEDGKLLTYRVIELGGKLKDNATFLPDGDHPEETAYSWVAKTATSDEEEFNIANITDPDNPTPRNRTVTVTNKHIPEKIKLSVSKDWADDDDDTSDRRAANITLYKTVNGAESVVEILDGAVPLYDETEFYTWEGLPAYEDGYPVTYRVEESPVEHYATTYKKVYTDTSGTSVNTDGDSIDSSDVERTWDEDTRDETTEGTINIRNANLQELKVAKMWVKGSNANITYKLYRTTSTDPDVIDWDETWTGWTPDSNWEAVETTVAFTANLFATSDTGDRKEKSVPSLPKADANGNPYTYRVWEDADATRYEANQISNTEVVNTNLHAEDGVANVNVVKELQGRPWNDNDKFYFKIEPYEDDGTIYHNQGAYGTDAEGNPITDPANVPMPAAGNEIQETDKNKVQVGAIGRNVGFDSIEFTTAQVDKDQTAEYYYKVYEVYDASGTSLDDATNHTGKKNGITYAGEVDSGIFSGSTFKPTEHTLRIVVSSDSNGKITTDIYWDGATSHSAVPVYTNNYDASAEVHAHIIKDVMGREITGDDEFNFTITNIAGAPMRATADAEADTSTQQHDAGKIDPNDGTKVTPASNNYDPVDGNGGNYRAIETMSTNWIKVGDLANKTSDDKATDTFIYQITENAPNAGTKPSKADDDDLTFDERSIYVKLVATDNLDGTLNIEKSYWYDAACTSNPVHANVLVSKADGSIAPAGSTPGEEYKYVPAAIFINSQTVDIPVVKEWTDGPAVEDVTLHLERKLIPLNQEEGLTYFGAESAPGYNNKGWETVGNVTIAHRGDFVDTTGAIITEDKTYEDVEGFNKDLPKYVTVDGTTYRAVYKLIEDKTSDAYSTTYRSKKGGTETDKNQVFLDGETLIVTNKVVAKNEANIAAVKQLMGRQWLDEDDFPFTLVPEGKGTYDNDGKYSGKDTSDEAKASVPMPENDSSRESTTTDAGTADAVATTHAKKSMTTVDPNGGLERLARFGAIEFDISDLTWVKDHYEGDFFYVMEESIPDDATHNPDGTYTKNGITYDGTSHNVHVKVTANRTDVLYVQIAYDEETVGDVTTGTQFTPVYTNKYDAIAEYAQDINKYIMGRAWKSTDVFDFRMTALGGAPFEDADRSEFPPVDTTSDDEREEDLEGGYAIHSARGAHVNRMKVSDTTKEIQELTMPKIEFRLSELNKTVTEEEAGSLGALTYSNGDPVPAGTAYGQFVYSFEETNDYLEKAGKDVKDLNIDPDTEYVRVTVIDKGDGTLDCKTEVFEDRYCSTPRYKPGTHDPATSPTFVNQLKRKLSITKAWADTPNSDVVMKLQWSLNGENWYDVSEATFLAGQPETKTIAKDATGDALTVTWTDLPAYANIVSVGDQTADDIDMNDLWVYYTITEDSVNNVITRYSEEPYVEGESYTNTEKYKTPVNGANPFRTEDAPSGESYAERTYADIIDKLHVTNWRTETEGTAKVGVVKQYIGKVWESETFTFEMKPVKSKLGSAADYTSYDDQVAAHETDPKVKVMPTLSDNKATADTGTDAVSVNEHAANFKGLVIKLSDLLVATEGEDKGKEKGEFIYEIKEVIPDDAVEMTEDGKTYFVKKDEKGNIIKYTTDTHTVKIIAVDDGGGDIDITVSYDERNPGEYVPVYTNYAMMPTPVDGTKEWHGGKKAEHQNGKVEIDDETGESKSDPEPSDNLKLKLKRKLTTSDGIEETMSTDDAGRDLVVVWVKETPATPAKPTGYWVSEEGDRISDEQYQAIQDEEEKAKYSKEMTPEVPASIDTQTGDDPDSTEKGNSGPYTYTIKAEVTEGGVTKYEDPLLNVCNEAGYEYEYYITETSVPTGYSKSEDGMDVVNTNNEKDKLKVTKIWDDAQDAERLRPDKVIVHLYKEVIVPAEEGGEATTKTVQVEVDKKTITKQEGDNKDIWSTGVVFEDLPLYDSNGNVIKYYVLEEGMAGYTGTYAANSRAAGDYKDEEHLVKIELDGNTTADPQFVDIKNSLTPATDEITIEKIWDDNNNAQGKRPSDVTFKLYKYVWNNTSEKYEKKPAAKRPAVQADVTAGKASKVGDDVAITDLELDGTADTENTIAYETEAWKGTWKNLPLTENGKTVIYTIEEDTEGSAYAAPGTQGRYSNTPCVTGNQFDGYKVKNVYTDELTEAKITKVWKDNNNAWNTRPRKLHVELYRTYEVADGQPVTPEKVTTDAEGNSIKEEISADDEDPDANTWVHKYNKLPKYTSLDVDGTTVSREYTYFWKETVPTGYVATGRNSGDQAVEVVGDGSKTAEIKDKTTVTNTYVTGSIVLTKTWDDQSDVDKLRTKATDYLDKLTLYMGDRKITDFSTITRECRDNGDNTFTVTYGNLPVFDKDGTAISYTVEETVPNGYSIATDPAAVLTTTLDNTQEAPTVFTGLMSLTNEHKPELIDIEITKNWIDQAGFEHIDAENYKNELKLLADGEEVTDTYADKLTITPSSEGTTEDVFGIKWSELPKYKVNPLTGKLVEIVYKVTERQVDGYAEATYDNTGAYDKSKKADTSAAYNGGEINNTQVISIDVKKTWDDNDNHDNKRGDIKVVLFRNGVKYAEKTLKETDDNISIDDNVWTWTGVWTGLEYADPKGTTYNYTASEEAPQPWYEAFVNGQKLIQILLDKWNDDNNTLIFEVTNKHDDETVEFTVDKIWDDKSDVDGLRPSKIYFRLYQTVDGTTTLVEDLPEGASVKTVTNTAGEVDGDADYDNGYVEIDAKKSDKTQGTLNRVFFEDLPKYAEGGKLITYTVEEDGDISTEAIEPVRAYTTERSGDQSAGYTFKNTHSPVSVTVNPKAKKALDGRSFKSGDEFTFKLTVDSPTNAPTPTPDLIKINPTSGTDKEFNIGEITFTGADMIDELNAGDTKKFTYKLTEVDAGKTIDDIIYSTQELTLEITVSRKADGGLEVTDSNIKWTGGDGDNHDTITNKFITDTDLIIRKIWVDDDADDTSIGSRPESITIVITAEASVETASLVDAGFRLDSEQSTDVKKVYTKEITVSGSEAGTLFNDSVWQKKITGLPKLDAAGESITYTVDENDVPNYTKTDPVQKDEGRWIITNTYRRVSITGTKEWRDGGKTHDNTTELKLTVYRLAYDEGGQPVGSAETVSDAHIDWKGNKYTVIGLPESDDNGNKYTYWVTETAVDGYEAPIYDNSDAGAAADQRKTDGVYDGGKVINSALTDITVTKTWDDADYFTDETGAIGDANEYTRPEVTMTVTATATTEEEITALTEAGFTQDEEDGTKYTMEITLRGETSASVMKWTKIIEDLPMYDQDGEKIKYVATETDADGDTTPDGFIKDEGAEDTEVSNKPKDKKENGTLDLTILKTDGTTEGDAGLNGAEFTVYQSNGKTKATSEMVVANPVTTSGEDADAGKATVRFKKPGTYVIKETKAPAGYALSEKTFTVKVDEELESITLTRETDPDDSFWTWLYKLLFNGDKPESMTGDDTHGYTLKVDDDPLRAEVLVDKVWDDKNDQDGLRKKAKDESALPKVKLQYKSGDQWLDADDTILGTQEGTKTVPDKDGKISGGRTYTWKDIPAYLDGEKVEYRVIEIDKIEGYENPTYDKQTFTLSNNVGTEAENVEVSVTNKYEPETASVQVSKKWNDINNLDEMRVDELSFKLTSNNGYEKTLDLDILTDVDDGEEAIETPDDAKWTKLPVYKNGEKIKYTLVESTKIKGYTATYDGDDAQAKNVEFTLDPESDEPYLVTVTNTHEPKATKIYVKKQWNDNNDQDGKRGEVEITLKAADDSEGAYDGKDYEGNEVGVLKLNTENNYYGKFDNLKNVDADGKKITYAVEETSAPSGYDTDDATYSGSGTHADPFVVTNTRGADTITVTATKRWTGDAEFKDETRKDVTLYLIGRKGDGGIAWDGGSETVDVQTDPGDNKDAGTATWTGLPRRLGGVELTWEVYEDAVPGYAASVSGGTPDEDGNVDFIVTNEYAGAVAEVTATKVWNDDNNRDGKRTDVYFQLYRTVGYDGDEEAVGDPVKVEVNTTSADGEEAGTVTWDNLPEVIAETDSETTEETVYNAVEPEGTENPSDEGWYELQGSEYVLTEDTEVDAEKTYYEQGTEEVTSESTTERAVIYTVKEVEAPSGYESVVTQTSAGEFVVNNIHTPETTDVSVYKIWGDDDDAEGFRPDHIKIRLKDGDETVREVTLTSEDEGEGWNSGTYTFEDVLKNKGGEPIDYSVVELDEDEETELVDGEKTSYSYDVSISGGGTSEDPFLIKNTHASGGITKLVVNKKWEGDEKHIETRGDVKYHLIKVIDGERVDTGDEKTATYDSADPDNPMTVTWEDLPTREKGKDVVYTVEEVDVPKGYTPAVGNVDEDGNVTVTNTYSDTPAFGEDVIYIDPLNNAGSMVLKSTSYDTHGEAKEAADNKTGAPANPKHEGYKFAGWAVNYDENGNFVIVATYSAIPEKVTPTTSYIDPNTGLLVSVQTDDPSSVKAPADPKAKNMQFVGWRKVTDAAGNTIFVAEYECDCGNGSGDAVDGSGKSGGKSGVKTGDMTSMYIWIMLLLLSIAVAATVAIKRIRKSDKEVHEYKDRH